MAAAVVTLRPSTSPDYVTGKYVCDASPSATNINVGFVPSVVRVWNVTDRTVETVWSQDMSNAQALSLGSSGAVAVSSGGITPVQQTDGTNHGFSIGTDASVQVASKTFGFIAYR